MKNSEFHIRPRFEFNFNGSLEDVYHLISKKINDPEYNFQGQVRLGFFTIFPNPDNHHIWSPHLSVSIDNLEPSSHEVIVSGLYGPSPVVWTFYVMIYSIIGLLSLIVLIIGGSNVMLGEPSMILWLVPFLAVVFATFYAVSYLGQLKARNQLMEMHRDIESIFDVRIPFK